MSYVSHSELRGKIEPFRTSCENDEKESLNMLSFSAQRAGNPAGQIFAQIFQKLGLRAPHEDDKNHVTQRSRVDFSLPNQYVTLRALARRVSFDGIVISNKKHVTLSVAKSLNDNFKEILHFVQNDRLYITLREQSDRRVSMVNLRRFFALRAQNDSKSTFSPRWEKVAESRMRGDIEQPNSISTIITPPAIVTHYVHTIVSSPSREDKSVTPFSTSQLLNSSTVKQEVRHA